MSEFRGQLFVQFGENIIQTLTLTNDVFSIGSARKSDVLLAHPLVNPRHAQLRVGTDGVWLTDFDSDSGTSIGETRLPPKEEQLFPPGIPARIGVFVFTHNVRGALATIGAAAANTSLSLDRPYPAARPLAATAMLPDAPSRYLADLPVIYHGPEQDFLGRYLKIFETLWEPLEQRQDEIAMYFNPYTCPASFLPWLAGWMGLALASSLDEPHCRLFIHESTFLHRWRGTLVGLARLIEIVVGVTPEIVDEPNTPYVISIRLVVPTQQIIERAVLEAFIRAYKPAHVAYKLDIQSPSASAPRAEAEGVVS